MTAPLPDPAFWAGKRVLLTGHTGFKGSWAALWLRRLGAHATGLALPPEGAENHHDLAHVAKALDGRIADLRDPAAVADVVRAVRPEIVLHLGAQALVRRSLRDPAATFATNVQGTANLLAALGRLAPEAATLVVTSDKVYRNDGTGRAFREDDPLGGKDPYSASKAACELLAASWRASAAAPERLPLATARGGNVIGGGDFGEDRLAPDMMRAARAGRPATLRHPEATRPWQHVLDCLCGYLLYLERLAADPAGAPRALNIGPGPGAPIAVARLAEALAARLELRRAWVHEPVPGSIEAPALALDVTRAREALGWRERLPGMAAIAATADWQAAYLHGASPRALAEAAFAAFEAMPAAAAA
ncbi:CDP-glucose 4,6-dehydratase [Rubrimonas cliftonensis]|uniref:CDP-glucose 4,6-dehydratase n=1 Tax=Rubrimonas cliftonensis TaxID=89524 RepID=A0A1H4G6V3_9RHOB|nr:CDP-glucose 4,6-dehydratase [Rubrimonas cliftonensis]SEB05319.1 CDP-glucose 4,6-dehydratase [Rubrimonas cliftonensis]